MRKVQFLGFSLLLISALFPQRSFAKDYTRWGLPEGAKVRLGKGWISGNIAFSPDGALLAVASSIGIWLYDATTGTEVNLLTGHTSSVKSVAFSPDGTTLASGSWDTTVRLWDVPTGKPLHTLVGHTDSVNSIAFSPDGSTLASRSRDNMTRLWDVDTGEPVNALERHEHWLSSIVFLPDGTSLVKGSSDGAIRSRDAEVVGVVPSLKGPLDWIRSAAFSSDGATLAIALRDWDSVWGDDTIIRLWDTRTREILHTLEGHWNGTGIHVDFSPDGDTVASAGGWDSMVRLWDACTGELLGRPQTFTSTLRSIAFSPDGSTLVWNRGEVIRSWNVRTGVLQRPSIGWHFGIVNSVAFSPDGETLASASLDDTIRVWDVRAREQTQTFLGHKGGVTSSVVFSPDGSVLASAGADKMVRLWDAHTGEELYSLRGHADRVRTIAFSPDGFMLASGSSDGTIRLWDVPTGEHVQTFEGHGAAIRSVAFSPDGQMLVSCGGYSDGIRLWNVSTGEHVQTLEGHTGWIRSVMFSPDGRTLVSTSEDDTMLLWDLRHLTTWGGIKRVAVDSTIHPPELSPSATALIPVETALLPNYPNPFNPETWIPYQLEKPSEVSLTIYDMKGQAVRTLEVGHQPAGAYRSRSRAAYWDGRNEMGETVANGVYFCTLSAGDFTATRKMLVGK